MTAIIIYHQHQQLMFVIIVDIDNMNMGETILKQIDAFIAVSEVESRENCVHSICIVW